jgi:hypothetical protein
VVASGKKTLEDAQRDTKEARLREAGPLVVWVTVKEMMGVPRQQKSLHMPDFPNAVVRFQGHSLWRVDDVRAYATGKRDFTHAPGIEQHLYMDEETVAAALKIDTALMRQRLRGQVTGAYTRVPRPCGKFREQGMRQTCFYWLRSGVEKEVESRRRRPGVRPSNVSIKTVASR